MKVSLLTPTADRPRFFERSVKCFLAQTHDDLEWVIVDGGNTPIGDDYILSLADHKPRGMCIRYHHVAPGTPLRAALNAAAFIATGDALAIWDDDDIYPPHRISTQLRVLLENPHCGVAGISEPFYYRVGTQEAWQYRGRGEWIAMPMWLRNGRRELFPFSDGDAAFVQRRKPWAIVPPDVAVCSIHPGNTSPKPVSNEYYHVVTFAEVEHVAQEPTLLW